MLGIILRFKKIVFLNFIFFTASVKVLRTRNLVQGQRLQYHIVYICLPHSASS